MAWVFEAGPNVKSIKAHCCTCHGIRAQQVRPAGPGVCLQPVIKHSPCSELCSTAQREKWCPAGPEQQRNHHCSVIQVFYQQVTALIFLFSFWKLNKPDFGNLFLKEFAHWLWDRISTKIIHWLLLLMQMLVTSWQFLSTECLRFVGFFSSI